MVFHGNARDLFEDARAASWELHRHDLRYNAMERRALSLGGASDSKVASGSIRDRMAPVDAMVDYESMMERRVAEWCASIDLAVRVLYGSDWDHGIARGMSMSHAEVMDCIYVQRMTLPQTARRVHWSDRKVCDLRRDVFAHIDAVGVDAAMRGM